MAEQVSALPALHTTGTFPERAVYNHGLRMEAVIKAMAMRGTRSVIDLGCGDGALAKKIIRSKLPIERYLGIDPWLSRLQAAGTDPELDAEHMEFIEGSMTELESVIADPKRFRKFGAVILLETIEHVPKSEVARIEEGVFGLVAPELVVVTTPDATKRLNEEQLKARGHHFEWDVPEFEEWASSVTDQYPNYSATVAQLSGPSFVRNTQVATFHQNL